MARSGEEHAEGRTILNAVFLLLSGPIIWGLYFAFAYGVHSWICAVGGREWKNMLPFLLVSGASLSLAVMGAMAVAITRPWGREAELRFETYVSFTLMMLSAIAIIWTAAAGLFLSRCDLLR